MVSELPEPASVEVLVHPGPGMSIYCDGGSTETPMLVLTGPFVEVMVGPPGTATVTDADVEAGDQLAEAAALYAQRLRNLRQAAKEAQCDSR